MFRADLLKIMVQRSETLQFSGASKSSSLPPYYFRHYVIQDTYLEISATDNHVYYLPADTAQPQDVGHAYVWLKKANYHY